MENEVPVAPVASEKYYVLRFYTIKGPIELTNVSHFEVDRVMTMWGAPSTKRIWITHNREVLAFNTEQLVLISYMEMQHYTKRK